MTKDATIEIIDTVEAHPDADRLDLAQIMGYTERFISTRYKDRLYQA